MKFCLGFLLLVTGWQQGQSGSHSLDAILEKHAASLGSLEAWRNIQSATYHLDIKEPKFHLQAVYRVVRSGKMRIDLYSNGTHIFTEAYDGTKSWQWQAGDEGVSITTEEAVAPLRRGIELPGHLYTLLDMIPRGHQLTFVRNETREGKTGHVLRLQLKDGHQKFYFIDAESGAMLANSDHRAFHPDLDPTQVTIETRKEDVRTINGMRKAFRNVNWDLTNDQWLGTTQILDLIYWETIADDYFRPDHLTPIPFPKRQ